MRLQHSGSVAYQFADLMVGYLQGIEQVAVDVPCVVEGYLSFGGDGERGGQAVEVVGQSTLSLFGAALLFAVETVYQIVVGSFIAQPILE